MGNHASRGFDYMTFVRLIEEGPGYLSEDQLIWTNSEKQCLQEFINLLKDPRVPWASSVQEAFNRVKLAVPKSKMAAEIHAYVENPLERDLQAFGSLHPTAQMCWIHFYCFVLFMWSIHQGRPPSLTFYESDLLYHVCRNGTGVDYERINLFIRAIEKIQVVNSTQPAQTLTKNRLLFGPFILLSGSIRCGSDIIETEDPLFMDPGAYSTDGTVIISGIDSMTGKEGGLASEKCGRCVNQGRHFLNRQKEESESNDEESVHERCGPTNNKEYLDEILFRLDVLCRFHKELGFKQNVS